jgi:hypothetical protein
MINNNILPYMRKDISTLVTLSATAIALMLLASPLALFNILQPVQAQTTLSFKTPIPANGTDSDNQGGALTFDAQGDTFRSSTELYASGTYTITDISTGVNSSGSISRVHGCCLSNPSNGDKISMDAAGSDVTYSISTSCSTSANNDISLQNNEGGEELDFNGPVECSSSSQGGNSTTQSSSSPMSGTTTQNDSDGDGISDSSDRCTHNSNPRCYKEGEEASTTTTPQQEQPSSNRTGNQTG